MLILGEPWARSGRRSKASNVDGARLRHVSLSSSGMAAALAPLRLRRTGIVNETGHHTRISSSKVTISRVAGHLLDRFALARMRVPISIEPE